MDEDRRQEALNRQEVEELSVPSGGDRSVPIDAVLSAVANEQRRAVLNSLNGASEKTLDYDSLVDNVADRVRDEAIERGSDEHQKRVRIQLRHAHLPKLEEIQVINRESETGHVQFVGDEMVQEVLQLIESYDTDE